MEISDREIIFWGQRYDVKAVSRKREQHIQTLKQNEADRLKAKG